MFVSAVDGQTIRARHHNKPAIQQYQVVSSTFWMIGTSITHQNNKKTMTSSKKRGHCCALRTNAIMPSFPQVCCFQSSVRLAPGETKKSG